MTKYVCCVCLSVQYACMVTKYDRHGYRPRRRPLIITSHAVYILNEKDFRLKLRVPFSNLTSAYLIVLLLNMFETPNSILACVVCSPTRHSYCIGSCYYSRHICFAVMNTWLTSVHKVYIMTILRRIRDGKMNTSFWLSNNNEWRWYVWMITAYKRSFTTKINWRCLKVGGR